MQRISLIGQDTVPLQITSIRLPTQADLTTLSSLGISNTVQNYWIEYDAAHDYKYPTIPKTAVLQNPFYVRPIITGIHYKVQDSPLTKSMYTLTPGSRIKLSANVEEPFIVLSVVGHLSGEDYISTGGGYYDIDCFDVVLLGDFTLGKYAYANAQDVLDSYLTTRFGIKTLRIDTPASETGAITIELPSNVSRIDNVFWNLTNDLFCTSVTVGGFTGSYFTREDFNPDVPELGLRYYDESSEEHEISSGSCTILYETI